MPRIDLDILNQLQTPAFYASSLATRPAFGFVGRIFIDSDSPSTGIYRDTGTSWIQIADQTGIIVTPTLQSVTTAGNTSNVGISVSANGIGIGTTIPATNRLDIHSASGINATFNGTGTTNAALQLQSAGVGKWTLQNNYNSAANDFVLTDVLNSINRLIIKNTGLATYTGYLNVANIAGSQNIQISGTAPAYTIIDTAGSGYAASIGMATVGNNFIQGSALGDLCLVSQNTIAGNLKLAVGSSNAAALNISPANRVQIGTSVDAGFLVDINGTTRISGKTTITGSTTAVSLLGQGQLISSTLVAAANNDVLVGLDINPTFTNGAFTGVSNYDLRIGGIKASTDRFMTFTSPTTLGVGKISTGAANSLVLDAAYGGVYLSFGGVNAVQLFSATSFRPVNDNSVSLGGGPSSFRFANVYSVKTYADSFSFQSATVLTEAAVANGIGVFSSTVNLYTNSSQAFKIFSTGNVLIQTGGTFTDVASSKLTIASTTQGFLPPRMTTTQKNAIATPATGLVVYDTTLNKLALYTGAAWETVTSV